MTKIILSGCCGYMGRVVTDIVAADEDTEIVAGIDIAGQGNQEYPVFAKVEDCNVEADVLIDFSSPKALDGLLAFCTSRKIAAIFCTTGYTEEQMTQIREAAAHTAVMKSANMSLGINLLVQLAKKATSILGGQFDIEIVEKHHNQKIDAPSGTALMIADAINESLGGSYHYVYDRHSKRQKREKTEIGLHAIRGGTIVGEHDIIFAGHDEVITLSHSAASKEVFAVGAVNAAIYLAKQKPGIYDMNALMTN